MEQGYALDLARQGIEVALMIMLPIMAVALFTGVLVSVFQALTQVQEMTLTFVPKLLGVIAVLCFLGNWMLITMVHFTQISFERIATVGRGS